MVIDINSLEKLTIDENGKQGYEISKYSDLSYLVPYKDNKINGIHYILKGTKVIHYIELKNNLLNGVSLRYDDYGKLISKSFYENDIPFGLAWSISVDDSIKERLFFI